MQATTSTVWLWLWREARKRERERERESLERSGCGAELSTCTALVRKQITIPFAGSISSSSSSSILQRKRKRKRESATQPNPDLRYLPPPPTPTASSGASKSTQCNAIQYNTIHRPYGLIDCSLSQSTMSSLTHPPPPKDKAPLQSKYRTKDNPPLLPQQPKPKPQPQPPISAKFQDKAKAHRAIKRTSLPPPPLRASKPWPGSGIKPPATADELIKHMSNLPSYLQRPSCNSGDNIQGKALNVGVLQWGDLQRYTGKNHSACATAKLTSPFSSHSRATTPKQQHPTNCSRDLDPHHSTFTIHYMRSISQSKFEGGTDTVSGEERCCERVRGGNKRFASNRSPTHRGQVEKVQIGLSGDLFGDIQVKDQCTHVPYSCPLPRENSDTCTTSSCSISNNNSSSLRRENAEAVSWEFTSHKRNTTDLNLSCSSAEPPPVVTRGRMSNVEATEREAASSKRGRQSPLRRMLDPLLKPRNVASASHHDSAPVGLRRPLSSAFSLSSKKKECPTGPTTCTESTVSIGAPSLQPQSISNSHFQQVEKVQSSTRQALLQLAWKGGLPVFMLSSGESDILGATVRRKCISDSAGNPELSYSIFTLRESKMKGGAIWIRPGNKGKKQHLVSNIVGEVRVSTSKSKCCNNSDIYHVSREFVLVGPQLVPVSNTESTIHELEMESPVNMELAAIITNMPTSGSLCCKTASVGSVTAILPSGIHGASARGEPSPLIERWRSGGGCDCGGWDEGCSLSVLSLVYNSEGSKSNWEETQARFELFPQGHSKEEGHAFSMTCFKEGLYTVEFKSSVPLLQAFAICISLLHSRSPLKQETWQEKTLGARNGGPPSSYMQCHPPLSPVGRA